MKHIEGLVQIKVIITSHDLSPDYTLYTGPNYTDHPQVNISWVHCIENIFTVQDFWATLRLPWKTEFALKIFTVLNIPFAVRIFEQLALALKNREWPDFIVLNIYVLQWRAVRFVAGETLSLSKWNLRVYELNGVA